MSTQPTEQQTKELGQVTAPTQPEVDTVGGDNKLPIDAFLKLRAADVMARIVDEMVDADKLNPRSRLADARLDYGQPHQYEFTKPASSPQPKEGQSHE